MQSTCRLRFFFLLGCLAGVGKDRPDGCGVSGLQGQPRRRLSVTVGTDGWARYRCLTAVSGLVPSLQFHQVGDFVHVTGCFPSPFPSKGEERRGARRAGDSLISESTPKSQLLPMDAV